MSVSLEVRLVMRDGSIRLMISQGSKQSCFVSIPKGARPYGGNETSHRVCNANEGRNEGERRKERIIYLTLLLLLLLLRLLLPPSFIVTTLRLFHRALHVGGPIGLLGIRLFTGRERTCLGCCTKGGAMEEYRVGKGGRGSLGKRAKGQPVKTKGGDNVPRARASLEKCRLTSVAKGNRSLTPSIVATNQRKEKKPQQQQQIIECQL